MTDTAIAEPTKRQIARRERSQSGRVTGRLKRTIDLIVWERRTDHQACVETGLSLSHLRMALKVPHVAAYYRAEREVLRTSEGPANIHALLEVRDQVDNQMARVQAVKALEQLGDDHVSRSAAAATPGLVVVINSGPQPVEAHDVGVSWRSDRKPE